MVSRIPRNRTERFIIAFGRWEPQGRGAHRGRHRRSGSCCCLHLPHLHHGARDRAANGVLQLEALGDPGRQARRAVAGAGLGTIVHAPGPGAPRPAHASNTVHAEAGQWTLGAARWKPVSAGPTPAFTPGWTTRRGLRALRARGNRTVAQDPREGRRRARRPSTPRAGPACQRHVLIRGAARRRLRLPLCRATSTSSRARPRVRRITGGVRVVSCPRRAPLRILVVRVRRPPPGSGSSPRRNACRTCGRVY